MYCWQLLVRVDYGKVANVGALGCCVLSVPKRNDSCLQLSNLRKEEQTTECEALFQLLRVAFGPVLSRKLQNK